MSESATDDQKFHEHLEWASEIVRTWPEWKQSVLGKIKEPSTCPGCRQDWDYCICGDNCG